MQIFDANHDLNYVALAVATASLIWHLRHHHMTRDLKQRVERLEGTMRHRDRDKPEPQQPEPEPDQPEADEGDQERERFEPPPAPPPDRPPMHGLTTPGGEDEN